MNIKILLIFFIAAILSSVTYGQTVTLKGNNKTLAGKTIFFCSYADQITYMKDTLGSCKVEPEGNFSCTFELTETKPVFTIIGAFKYLIYPEPEKIYQIAFPENKEKTKAEEINPFFEEITLFFKLENSSPKELSNAILRFDLTCNDYINARYNEIYKYAKNSGVDKMIKSIDSSFSDITVPYFKNYKEYKYALIKYFAYVRNEQTITREFYKGKPVLYYNSAYMNLFNQAYDNYFTYFAKTPEGSTLPDLIGKAKSVKRIKKLLQKNSSFDDEKLQELIILKGLHDCLLAGEYEPHIICQTLDSMILQTDIPLHKKIAQDIQKIAKEKAPVVTLQNMNLFSIDSTYFKMDKFAGKFVYIGFCTCKSYPCTEEFELLKIWKKKNNTPLEFITVFVEENTDDVKEFVKKNHIDWTVLYCNKNSKLLKSLKVRTYPTYYLFDMEGQLLVSFTKTVKEGFEEFFMRNFNK